MTPELYRFLGEIVFWVTCDFVDLLCEINRQELVISAFVFLMLCMWYQCWLLADGSQLNQHRYIIWAYSLYSVAAK